MMAILIVVLTTVASLIIKVWAVTILLGAIAAESGWPVAVSADVAALLVLLFIILHTEFKADVG